MRLAVAVCDERISPVFDVAGHLLLVDLEDGREATRREVSLEDLDLAPRAARLAELGAEVLICGAISQPLERMLHAAGVEVIPHICGRVEAILTAFRSGTLDQQTYTMPGCRGRRRFRGGGGCGRRGQGRRRGKP